MSGTGNIAKRWRQLSGIDNWNQLLDPLDIDLRRCLIYYGDMAQATYDTFISERASDDAGDSRYSMKNLFSKVGLTIANPFNYEAVKYFYATSTIEVPECYVVKSHSKQPWNRQSNWIGYVAVATDEGKAVLGRRDIVIAWRGTIMPIEWYKDFEFPLVSASEIIRGSTDPQVHLGFLSLYTSNNPDSPYNIASAREQVIEEVKRLMEEYKNEEISMTIIGHSLGAALATLNAVDIVANGYNKTANQECPVTAFVYASPRVGDLRFKLAYDSFENLHLLRITNAPDIVPKVPDETLGYVAVGNELVIDTQLSNYLLQPGDIKSWHNLEVYIHGIAGTQGLIPEFHLEVKRDIALVNKEIDILRGSYRVPGAWRTLKNKGMVQMNDGFWRLEDEKREVEEADSE